MWPTEKLKRCGPEGVDCRFRVGLGLYYGEVSCENNVYSRERLEEERVITPLMLQPDMSDIISIMNIKYQILIINLCGELFSLITEWLVMVCLIFNMVNLRCVPRKRSNDIGLKYYYTSTYFEWSFLNCYVSLSDAERFYIFISFYGFFFVEILRF